MKWSQYSVVVALGSVVMASCTAQRTAVTTPLASAPGVTTTSILLGTDTALSGPDATMNGSIEAGERAVFAAVDAHGGLFGRRVSLIASDNGGNSTSAVQVAQSLANVTGVFALVGDNPTSVEPTLAPAITKLGIPAFFPAAISNTLRPGTVPLMPTMVTQANIIGTALGAAPPPTLGIFGPSTLPLSLLGNRVVVAMHAHSRIVVASDSVGLKSKAAGLAARVFAASGVTTVVSFGGVSSTASLVASLLADHVTPTVYVTTQIASTSDLRLVIVAQGGAAGANVAINRVALTLPLVELSAMWRSEIDTIAAYLPKGQVLNGATTQGIMIGLGTIELIRAGGINPTRRILLTDVVRPTFRLALPLAGSWSPTQGATGGVVVTSALAGHATVVVDGHEIRTPKSVPLPPRI
ncbi:MAG: ABC transporter substrate-binding protein [Ferrimicrobium sp.]